MEADSSVTNAFSRNLEGSGPCQNLGRIFFEECLTSGQRALFKRVVDGNHAYIRHVRTPTRKIDWLVRQGDGRLIGAIGINSCVLQLKPRDEIVWKKFNLKNRQHQLRFLRRIANNYRFAMIEENVAVKNAGSRILRKLRILAPVRWKQKYGDRLVAIETFVKPPWTGTVYKADNWRYLGMTKGFSSSRLPLQLIDPRYRKSETRKFMARTGTKSLKPIIFRKTTPKHIFFKFL